MLVEKYLWFLNAAVEMRIDLDVLASPELAVALNRPPHKCAATFSRKSVARAGGFKRWSEQREQFARFLR